MLASGGGRLWRQGRGLTADEKAVLEEVRRECEDWLTPVTIEEIGALVLPVITSMVSQSSGEASEIRAAAYVIALGGEPKNALELVTYRILRREIPEISARYAPTPPELAELTREAAAPWRRRLKTVEDYLAMGEAVPRRVPIATAPLVEDTLRAFANAGGRAQAAVDAAIARHDRVEADLAGRNFPPVPSQAQEARSAAGATGIGETVDLQLPADMERAEEDGT